MNCKQTYTSYLGSFSKETVIVHINVQCNIEFIQNGATHQVFSKSNCH